jgi:hypothetical protein
MVGLLFLVATAFQAWWWGIHTRPSTAAIFWLSIEALFFGAYNVIPTALGYRKTEHVEAKVIENIEQADQVVEGGDQEPPPPPKRARPSIR